MRKIARYVAAIVGMAGCTQPPSIGSSSSAGGGVVGRALVTDIQTRAPNTQAVSGDLLRSSVELARSQGAVLGLTNRDDFVTTAERLGADGLHHVRLQQLHDGIKVWGSDAVVHANETALLSMSGNLTVGLQGLDLVPAISDGTALESAKA